MWVVREAEQQLALRHRCEVRAAKHVCLLDLCLSVLITHVHLLAPLVQVANRVLQLKLLMPAADISRLLYQVRLRCARGAAEAVSGDALAHRVCACVRQGCSILGPPLWRFTPSTTNTRAWSLLLLLIRSHTHTHTTTTTEAHAAADR